AGGHLAASAATLFNDPDGKTGAELDQVSGRPDFAVLVYPVITMKDPFAHVLSRKDLIGDHPTPEAINHMSLELHVQKDPPPVFIACTEADTTVKVENDLIFYQALRNAGVPAELHIWPKGGHGFGMKKDIGEASTWPDRCEEWLRANGFLISP